MNRITKFIFLAASAVLIASIATLFWNPLEDRYKLVLMIASIVSFLTLLITGILTGILRKRP